MLRDFIRIIGSACILAGGILYFFPSTVGEDASKNTQLKSEITILEEQLDDTSKELANLKISVKEKEATDEEPKKEVDKEEVTEEEEKVEQPTSEPTSNDSQTLIIEPGMDSTTVANNLAEMKIIEDAPAFALYLDQNKLAGKIQIGEYELNNSMSYKEIVDIIASS